MSDPILDAFKSAAPPQQDDPIIAAFGGATPDVRQQIEYRKQNPPAASHGDPRAVPQSLLEQVMPALAHPVAALSGFANAVNPVGLVQAVNHPIDTIQNDAAARAKAFNDIKPSTGITDPQAGENVRNLFAALVPFFGPAMASAGRQMESADPTQRATGFGAAIGNTSGPAIVAKAPALAGAAGDAASVIRTAATETIPTKISNATIGATRKYFKFGANPGDAVKGLVYNSVDELPAKLESEVIKPNATRLNQVLATDAAKTKVIDLDSHIQAAFQEAIDKAERDGNLSLADTLKQRMQGRLDAAHAVTNGQRFTDPASAYRVMKQLGDDTKWTADPVEGTVEDAKQGAYQQINSAIDKAVPAAVPLTRKLANALTAQKAVQTAIENGQSTHPFLSTIDWLRRAGSVGAAFAGHPSALLALAPDVMRATPVASRVSAGLSRLARPEVPLPQTTPSPTFSAPQAPLALPPGRTPLALPPAPDGFSTAPPAVPSSGVGLPRVFPGDPQYLQRLRELGVTQ